MSLTYSELQILTLQLRFYCGSQLESIFLSSPYTFVLQFRAAEPQKKQLLISLRTPFLRLHPPLNFLRPAPLENLERGPLFCRSLACAKGQRLQDLYLIEGERAVCLAFDRNDLVVELFPKRPNLLWLEKPANSAVRDPRSTARLLASLHPPAASALPRPQPPSSALCRFKSWQEAAIYYTSAQETFEKQGAQKKLQRCWQSKLDQERRRFSKAQRSLQESLSAPLWRQRAQLLLSHAHEISTGAKFARLRDWQSQETVTLSLDPKLSAIQNSQKLFSKSKALAARQPLIEQLLRQVEKNMGKLEQILSQHPLPSLPSEVVTARRSLIRTFYSAKGREIWVGKNKKGNDWLTFCRAKGNDWWLHLADFPSSHLVVASKAGEKSLDEETLQDALQLALYFCRAKPLQAFVLLAQCKHLKKVPKKLGQVSVAGAKKLQAQFDPLRLQRLLLP